MKTYKQFLFEHKSLFLYIFLVYVVAGIAVIFREPLHGIFGESNYVTIHLIIEIFVAFCSLAIATQIRLSSKFKQNNKIIYTGALFFAIGILGVAHAIAFKGMPFFIHESSPYAATWFYMATRYLFPIGFLVVFLIKGKQISASHRLTVYTGSFSLKYMGYLPLPFHV